MRAFVAIELPDDLRATLAREQSRLRASCQRNRDIRWTAPESLHLTLRFLGEIAADRVAAVIAALQSIGPHDQFEVDVRGFGFFPDSRRPHVMWAGLEAPPSLGELARQVDAALAKLGFPSESRPFTPHLTLARFRTPRADRALLEAVGSPSSTGVGRFHVNEFFLFESRLLPGGAEHTKIARFALA
jgi:RNA 2',3'-cyclic 3'-phosphodiesterase